MKDRFYYLLFKLGENALVSRLYWLYYKMAIFSVKFFLNKLPFVKHAYLKGSFGKEYFLPVVSDLDFFIIGNKNEQNDIIINRTFNILHLFFPIVSDFDFHGEREADLLKNFAGVKFFNTEAWFRLKGSDFKFEYRFYPRKFYVDIVHEIYFQMEWLFINLKSRRTGDKFKSICIQRQYEKIIDLINYLSFEQKNFKIHRRKFSENKRWHDYSNEKIISKFNSYLEKSKVLKEIGEIYQWDFLGRDISEVPKETYFKEQLVLCDKDFKYDGKLHYFTKRNFELFYLIGCIDSYLLLEWTYSTNDSLGKLFIKSLYFARLLEKRGNLTHGEQYYFDNQFEAIKIRDQILAGVRYESFEPKNYFGRDVCIIVPPKYEESASFDFVEKLNIPFDVLTVKMTTNKDKRTYRGENAQLCVYNEAPIKELDYQMNLFNFGVHWCFGAKNLFLTDLLLESATESFWNKLSNQLDHKDFIQIKNKENEKDFLWGASYLNWKALNRIYDKLSRPFINDILSYQVSSTPLMELCNRDVLDQLSNIESSNKTIKVWPVLTGSSNPKDSTEQEKIIAGIFTILDKAIEYDELGFITINNNDQKMTFIEKLLNSTCDSPYDILYFSEELMKIFKISDFKYFSLTQSDKWSLKGLGVIVEGSDGFLKFRTGTLTDAPNLTIKSRSLVLGDSNKEIKKFKFRFNNKISEEELRLDINFTSGEEIINNLPFKGDELFSIEFSFVTFANEHKSKDSFEFTLNSTLNRDKTYELHLEQSESINLPDEEEFRFYKKIEDGEVSFGKLHRGFYKILVNLNSPLSGKIWVVDNFNKAQYQSYYFEKENCLCLYHSVYKECDELFIVSSQGKLDVNTIDMLISDCVI